MDRREAALAELEQVFALIAQEHQERGIALGGVATLLPVHALPCGNDLPGSLGVVVNGGLSVGRRVVGEQLGTEESRLD
jgi:hypothetical protein